MRDPPIFQEITLTEQRRFRQFPDVRFILLVINPVLRPFSNRWQTQDIFASVRATSHPFEKLRYIENYDFFDAAFEN